MVVFNKKKFEKGLERWGEDEVRLRLVTGTIRGELNVPHAYEWLRRKEEARARAREKESMTIARDAAKAAKKSASSAKAANIISVIAVIIAAAAVLISIIALFQETLRGDVSQVHQPKPVTGGADPEKAEPIRKTAPEPMRQKGRLPSD